MFLLTLVWTPAAHSTLLLRELPLFCSDAGETTQRKASRRGRSGRRGRKRENVAREKGFSAFGQPADYAAQTFRVLLFEQDLLFSTSASAATSARGYSLTVSLSQLIYQHGHNNEHPDCDLEDERIDP